MRPFPPCMQKERARERRMAKATDKGHGRFEIRTLTSTTSLNKHLNWPGVKQVLRVENETTRAGKKTREVRYFVTSLSRGEIGARRLLEIVRGHWGAIENGLHWIRDVVFREDRSTISTGNAPQNLAALRNAVLTCARDGADGKVVSKLRGFMRKFERAFDLLGIL